MTEITFTRHLLVSPVDCGPSSDTVLVKFPQGNGHIFELAMMPKMARWLADSLIRTADFVEDK